jgi:hypothetical protein
VVKLFQLRRCGGGGTKLTIDAAKVNQKLLPLLKNQTQDHCSFCDAFPVDPPSIPTIEHFRPKTAFPKEAFKWENLYYR